MISVSIHARKEQNVRVSYEKGLGFEGLKFTSDTSDAFVFLDSETKATLIKILTESEETNA